MSRDGAASRQFDLCTANHRDKGSFEPVPVGFFFFERFFFFFAAVGSPSSLASAASSASSSAAASSFSAASAPSSVAAGFFFFCVGIQSGESRRRRAGVESKTPESYLLLLFLLGCRGLAALSGRGGVERLLLFFVARVVLGHWCWLCAIAGALAALFCEPCYWYACTVVACKVQHSLLAERSSLDCSGLEELSLLQPRTAGLWRAAWTACVQFANEQSNAIS